jgi:perosamine synthetase
MNMIPMAGPSITNFEKQVISDMMDRGWDNYEYVEKFESEFAAWHGRKYCLMTPCCTHAIHLLILALGIKDGDEVIVPECTWTATAAPITYEKAKPVFADISEDTWCLDPDKLQASITAKTKAIIVVDLYGNMPPMETLEEIAAENNIYLIEDAAEALGSKYRGIRAGKFGIGSVHSFHRTKTITSGEGGALLLDDDKIYERAKFLRDHGRSPTIPYYTLEATTKYMPSNIQGALAWSQFQRIDELVNRKRYLFHQYKKLLEGVAGLQFNLENDDVYNGVWATSVVFPKNLNQKKSEVISKLNELGVPARPFFYPLSSLPAYSGFDSGSPEKNPIAYDLSGRGITLSCHYNITNEQILKICSALKEVLKK